LKDIRKGTRDGEKEEPVAKAARELQGSSARSVKSAEWSLSNELLYFQGKIYVPDSSNLRRRTIVLSHDSRLAGHSGRWKMLELVSRNYCGHRCQGMLAGMSPPVTCASGPNHSNILRSGNSSLFLFHLPLGTLSAWTSSSSCHNLQDMIPSWSSSILSQSVHTSFPLSLQSLPPELHTFSSTMCGNITVSLGKLSPIEVPNS